MKFRRRPFLKAFLALLVFPLIFVLLVQRKNDRQDQEIKKKLAAIRAAGFPVNEKEVTLSFPSPSPEKDASLLLQQSFSLLVRSQGTSNLPSLERRESSGTTGFNLLDRESVQKLLFLNHPALEALPKAWPSNAKFPLKRSNLFDASSLPLVDHHYLTYLLLLNVCYLAQEDKIERSVGWFEYGMALSRTWQGSSWLAQSVGRMRESSMMVGLEWILNYTTLNPSQLLILKKVLEEEGSNTFQSALIFDRCYGFYVFEEYKKEDGQLMSKFNQETLKYYTFRMLGLAKPIFRREDYLNFLDITDNYLSASRLPGEDRWKRLEEMETRLKFNWQSYAGLAANSSWVGKSKREMETIARLRAGQTAVAIERFRLDCGKLPSALSDLVPEYLSKVPIDPFKNEALIFKQTHPGYLVYSLGPNKTDDGGADRYHSEVKPQWDIPIKVDR